MPLDRMGRPWKHARPEEGLPTSTQLSAQGPSQKGTGLFPHLHPPRPAPHRALPSRTRGIRANPRPMRISRHDLDHNGEGRPLRERMGCDCTVRWRSRKRTLPGKAQGFRGYLTGIRVSHCTYEETLMLCLVALVVPVGCQYKSPTELCNQGLCKVQSMAPRRLNIVWAASLGSGAKYIVGR